MGWFWADKTPSAAPVAPHPMPRGGVAEPPPGCPMHQKKPSPPRYDTSSTSQGACPYVPPDTPTPASQSTTTASDPPRPRGLLSRLNPMNNMFSDLSQSPESAHQTTVLPVSRETSTIPKGDGSLWEYPSPQQMYNALLRKGYTDTPADAIESMVAVHNFLNEGAWAEIVGWEARFSRGLVEGYRLCSRGEENAAKAIGQTGILDTKWRAPISGEGAAAADTPLPPPPKLLKFTGRPDELTPKARMLQFLSQIYPGKFATPPPFDRHDWTVQRCSADGVCKEVRYVIDYYEGEDEGEDGGEPVFYLDVRPAVDRPTQVAERAIRWGTDVWWRASGGVVREVRRMEEERKKAEEARRG